MRHRKSGHGVVNKDAAAERKRRVLKRDAATSFLMRLRERRCRNLVRDAARLLPLPRPLMRCRILVSGAAARFPMPQPILRCRDLKVGRGSWKENAATSKAVPHLPMKTSLSIAHVLSDLEAQLAHHEGQEAFHAQQEVFHREQRILHAEKVGKVRERYEAFKAGVVAAGEIFADLPQAAPAPPVPSAPPPLIPSEGDDGGRGAQYALRGQDAPALGWPRRLGLPAPAARRRRPPPRA